MIVPCSLVGSLITLAEEETKEPLGKVDDGNDVPDDGFSFKSPRSNGDGSGDGVSDVGSSGDNITGEKLLG